MGLLHGNGFGDMDFNFYIYGTGQHNTPDFCRQQEAIADLLYINIRLLAALGVRSLLFQNAICITLVVILRDGCAKEFQFFLYLFDSVSELMVSSDLDVSQVVLTMRGQAEAIFLSPMAIFAYQCRCLSLRSLPIETHKVARLRERVFKYFRRDFGVRMHGTPSQVETILQPNGQTPTNIAPDYPFDRCKTFGFIPVQDFTDAWLKGRFQQIYDSEIVCSMSCRHCRNERCLEFQLNGRAYKGYVYQRREHLLHLQGGWRAAEVDGRTKQRLWTSYSVAMQQPYSAAPSSDVLAITAPTAATKETERRTDESASHATFSRSELESASPTGPNRKSKRRTRRPGQNVRDQRAAERRQQLQAIPLTADPWESD